MPWINPLDWNFNFIEFTGIFVDPETSDPIPDSSVTTSGLLEDVSIKRMAKTEATIPVLLDFQTTDPSGTLVDPSLVVLSNACGASRQQLELEYTIQADVSLISFSGYKPEFTGRIRFACPISQPVFSSALAGLNGVFTPSSTSPAPLVPDSDPSLAEEAVTQAEAGFTEEGAVQAEAGVSDVDSAAFSN